MIFYWLELNSKTFVYLLADFRTFMLKNTSVAKMATL